MLKDTQFPDMLKLYESDVEAYPGSHLDLPIKVAMRICRKFPSYWDYIMDFIQEGNLELLRCVEVFNQEHPEGSNEHFRNYAAACIRGVIYLYFSRIHQIYIPSCSRQQFVNQGHSEVLEILEQHYKIHEIYDRVAQIAELTNIQQAFYEAKIQQVQTLLTRLSPVEKQVIILRYGIEGIAYGPDEIAHQLQITTSYVYVLTLRALARMNGKKTELPRVQATQQQRKARTALLKPHYDQHDGKITQRELVDITGCTHHQAGTFLREQRGITKEMSPGVRREKMEALFTEWQAQGKKITVRAFCKAGHWDTQEAGTFLREKRNRPFNA